MVIFIGHNFAQGPKRIHGPGEYAAREHCTYLEVFFKDSLKLEYSYLQA
jgi:hypothetical protein